LTHFMRNDYPQAVEIETIGWECTDEGM